MSSYLLHTQGDLELKSDTLALTIDADLTLGAGASAANWRTSLSAQESSTKLDDVAAVSVADSMVYYDGANFQSTPSTNFGRGLLADVDATAVRSTIGVVIGTDVQAQDAALQDIADVVATNGQSLQYNGTNWVAYTPTDNARGAGNGLSLNGNDLEIDTAITADLSSAQTLTSKTIEDPVVVGSSILENSADSARFEYVEVAKVSTANATPVALYSRVMGDDSVVLIKLAISAIDASGNVNAYEAKAVFARGTGAASVAMKTAGYNGSILCEGNVNLDFSVVANTTSGGYDVNVTGDAVDAVEWVAKISEVVMG